MRTNRRAGLSEAATVAVLILVALMVAGIVVIWEAQVGRSASEAGGAAAVTEIQRIRQDVSLIYWGPDGTVMLASRARDPVTIVRVYIDSTPRTVSWIVNPGETKSFNLGVGYDPLKEVTALTNKNELIVLWRSGGSGIAADTIAITTIATTRTTTRTAPSTTVTTTRTAIARITIEDASLTVIGGNYARLDVHVKNLENVKLLIKHIYITVYDTIRFNIICSFYYPLNEWFNPGQTVVFTNYCSGVIKGATYIVSISGSASGEGIEWIFSASTQVTAR
jgi:hypothetical protein